MYYLLLFVLAALETTATTLPLIAFTSVAPSWALLLLSTLAGCALDHWVQRRPTAAQGAWLVGGALLVALGATGWHLGRSPWQLLPALMPGGPRLGTAYLTMFVALYLFWRGTRLSRHDSASTYTFFGRGAFSAIIVTLLGPALRPGQGAAVGNALMGPLIGYVGLGLAAMALVRAEAEEAGLTRSLGWRWIATLALAIGLVLIGGLSLVSIASPYALEALRGLLTIIVLPFALLGALLGMLLGPLLITSARWLLSLFQGQGGRFAEMQQLLATLARQNETQVGQSSTLFTATSWVLALLPLVGILALIWFARRWRRQPIGTDEERESLGGWAALGTDLGDWLANLHLPFTNSLHGLRAALAALHGNDPTTRTRRAYIRMLMALEQRQCVRTPEQTPAELAAQASPILAEPAAMAQLTLAYERARYHPDGARAADAERAEAALKW